MYTISYIIIINITVVILAYLSRSSSRSTGIDIPTGGGKDGTT